MKVEVEQTTRNGLRVGRGRVEVEATPRRLEGLRGCLADRVCRQFLLLAVAAQLGDAAITNFALHRGFIEENALMRLLVFNPLLGGAVKVALVLTVCSLAAQRLSVRQARLAFAVAAGLSLLGPVIDTLQLLLHG
jgi:Domain of unknown function (DUF5658)